MFIYILFASFALLCVSAFIETISSGTFALRLNPKLIFQAGYRILYPASPVSRIPHHAPCIASTGLNRLTLSAG